MYMHYIKVFAKSEKKINNKKLAYRKGIWLRKMCHADN